MAEVTNRLQLIIDLLLISFNYEGFYSAFETMCYFTLSNNFVPYQIYSLSYVLLTIFQA